MLANSTQIEKTKLSIKHQNLVNKFLPRFCLGENRIEHVIKNKHETKRKHMANYICKHSSNCHICKINGGQVKKDEMQFLLDVHDKVKTSGKYNFEGCKIRINNHMNMLYLRNLLADYKDQQLCDLLEFGFPIGYKGDNSVLKEVNSKSIWKYRNHKGAEEFPQEMLSYLEKESLNKAIIGPFKASPFESGIKISPLNSLPKRDTEERRVILDLSYPRGASINDHISREEYLDNKIDLVYPKVDDFIQLIKQKGKGCLLFKKDLRRAYRQIPICPSNYNLVAFSWRKHIFCDTVLSMGMRSAAYICQRVTNAISFIMFKLGIAILNYLDDLASAETEQNAQFAYNTLGIMQSSH